MVQYDDLVIRIGGRAGDGVASVGQTLAKLFTRQGVYVHGLNYYQSVVRGGLVGWNVRVANHPVRTQGNNISVLIALTSLAVKEYGKKLAPNGIIIHDEKRVTVDLSELPDGVQAFGLPLVETAQKIDMKLKVLQNTVALGSVIAMLGIKLELYESMLKETFGRKGEEVLSINIQAARAGYQLGKEFLPQIEHGLVFSNDPKIFISANEAAALGAMAAGLQFYAAYPMTPASSILHFLAQQAPKYGLVVKQVEDELGVINTAIGASFAGAKAMCATSGGGFALMTEAVGLAGMIETPLVIINSMRGGPSTGLPTQTEQGDLNQLLGASQGDYPRMIIAPLNVEDAYYSLIEAMNKAEKYQIPVLVALDLYLSEHFEALDDLDLEPEVEERLRPERKEGEKYLRYKFTENGVSPRAIPGEDGFMFDAGSDEHDEDGKLISDIRAGFEESLVIRKRMMEKRGRKIEYLKHELKDPIMYGDLNADITIVGWGSSTGAIQEAVDELNKQGIKANSLHIRYIHPFNDEKILPILKNAKNLLLVESNYSGQMRRHIRAETGFWIENALLKYDGAYLEPQEIIAKVKEVMA